jgi:CRP/FNR family cyclic AMP-dependent transcriptional regulator
MDGISNTTFDPINYLATAGPGRNLLRYGARQTLFIQGDKADAVFYLQSGRAKLTCLSRQGKEATVGLVVSGDFVGEEAIVGTRRMRLTSATAITSCVVLRIAKDHILRTLHEESSFSDFFVKFMVARGIRTQADLIDQLFNSSERRLARILLLMADYGKPGQPQSFIAPVTQQILAEIIGTTRSRVNFIMNRFREMGHIEYRGHIEYEGHIRINKSLLNVILR